MRVLLVLLVLTTVAEAKPTEEGRAIVFVVDQALSPDNIEVVRKAVTESTYFASDQYGVVAFDAKKATVVRAIGSKKARAPVPSTTEATNLVAGLEAAHAMLVKWKRARLVVVFTDRESTTGVDAAIAKLRADNITVTAIGVEKANELALKAIATAGKGRHYMGSTVVALQKELNRPPPGQETFAYVFVIEQSSEPVELEASKEFARQRAEAIRPNDFITVIGYDANATVYVRPQRAANRMRISPDISRIPRGVGSNLVSALKLAFENVKTLRTSDKHVVVFGTGEGEGVIDVVEEMANADIVVSAVGYKEADRKRLQAIAKAGKGVLEMPASNALKMR